MPQVVRHQCLCRRTLNHHARRSSLRNCFRAVLRGQALGKYFGPRCPLDEDHPIRRRHRWLSVLERSTGRAEGRKAGRAAEARALLALLGEQKFGPPDARVRAALEAIGDAERLEALARRLLTATSWDDLLGRP